ncbi:TolC family protein [Candidatus Sumerlaeota bacterium]|nr:TolC family protein [Candidatus Sumerlaeota bacterium]
MVPNPKFRTAIRFLLRVATLGGLLLSSGCLGHWAKRLADREVYPIIKHKEMEALGKSREFNIEPKSDPLSQSVRANAGTASDDFTTAGLRISLADSVSLAIHNSRTYQNQKENLYLSALDLTLERHRFSPIFTGLVTGEYKRAPVLDAMGNVTDATRKGTINTDLAVGKVIAATGARISVGIANSFTRFYSAPPAETETGLASASIVQPLLRGAGMRVATENLKQAERNVIYQVRAFSRFEKGFVVDRIEEYFRLLQSLNTVANERKSYDSLTAGRERSEALAQAGRIDIFQADQARQQELNARNRWINAQTNFVQQLDRFKINLGLPTDLAILPDDHELAKLMDGGLKPMEIKPDGAVATALVQRLDYQTAKNEREDSERRLGIEANRLLPDLNATGSISIPSEGDHHPLDFDFDRRTYSVGGELNLPLDRKAERNNYRRAMIEIERAKRNEELIHDSILQEVRSTSQDLEEARNSYEIQNASLKVAERRVDSATMLLQAGRKTVRDVLESEVSLRDARNGVTRAIIDYTIAQLRFLVAIEALEIDDEGMWKSAAQEDAVADAKQ